MPPDISYLHEHKEFGALIRIVADERGISPAIVEKDYWVMHCLYGLQKLGLTFELKGGTSLSKGFGLIDRFSEDLDIWIEPPTEWDVATGKNQSKPQHIQSRKGFYDKLTEEINIEGIDAVRDTEFDDCNSYMSGGIRLNYKTLAEPIEKLKVGVLLEVGFDKTEPHMQVDISSWAYDRATSSGVSIIDNRAKQVACYHPGYTLVEKMQAVSKKYRQQQEKGKFPENFLRHYYDIFYLLNAPLVQEFIETSEYQAHKEKRFGPNNEKAITRNEAFMMSDPAMRAQYDTEYRRIGSLCFGAMPSFEEVLDRIGQYADKL